MGGLSDGSDGRFEGRQHDNHDHHPQLMRVIYQLCVVAKLGKCASGIASDDRYQHYEGHCKQQQASIPKFRMPTSSLSLFANVMITSLMIHPPTNTVHAKTDSGIEK